LLAVTCPTLPTVIDAPVAANTFRRVIFLVMGYQYVCVIFDSQHSENRIS
jgi:hypothetical protein